MEYITVKELFKITKGKKVEEIDYENENSIRYIQIDDLRNNNNIKHCENINKYVIAKKEDIIIAWDGANAGTIGFGIEGAIGSTLAILRKENKEMDTEFCGLFLRSKSAYLREKCTGATIPHIQRTALEDIKIPKISLNKQIEIKNIINKAQELIDKRKEQIEALDELVKSQFIKMFGDEHNKIPIGDLCSIKARIGWQGLTRKEYLQEGNYRLVTGVDFKNGKVDFERCYYVTKDRYEQDENIKVKVGDVLVTKDGTIGKVAIVDKVDIPATLNSGVFVVRDITGKLNNIFLVNALLSDDFKRFVDNIKVGATVPHLNQGTFVKYEIPVPPIELQSQFADFAKQVDKLKFEMEKSLKELEDNFNSLMQKAFKGELFN